MKRIVRWGVLVGIVIGVVGPLLPLLIWSFAQQWLFPNLWPQRWGVAAWEYVFSPSSRVAEALGTSLGLALLVTVLAALIGAPAAWALAKYQFAGKRLIEWLILAPLIVPTLTVVMGLHIFFIRYGLADSWIGVALVHLIPALPYFVLVMAGVFANYSVEINEAARTLGAGTLRTIVYVMLPLIAPGLVVASLFTFLVSWSQYITTLLIGGGQVITLPLVLFPFISGANQATAAALSLVFIAPAILVIWITSTVLDSGTAALGGFNRV